MPLRFAEPAPEVYQLPLTIRHLLDSALMTAADQRIVYRDQGEYEALSALASPDFPFKDFDENAGATTFYHRHHG